MPRCCWCLLFVVSATHFQFTEGRTHPIVSVGFDEESPFDRQNGIPLNTSILQSYAPTRPPTRAPTWMPSLQPTYKLTQRNDIGMEQEGESALDEIKKEKQKLTDEHIGLLIFIILLLAAIAAYLIWKRRHASGNKYSANSDEFELEELNRSTWPEFAELVTMGFHRSEVAAALLRSNNDLADAKHWLWRNADNGAEILGREMDPLRAADIEKYPALFEHEGIPACNLSDEDDYATAQAIALSLETENAQGYFEEEDYGDEPYMSDDGDGAYGGSSGQLSRHDRVYGKSDRVYGKSESLSDHGKRSRFDDDEEAFARV